MSISYRLNLLKKVNERLGQGKHRTHAAKYYKLQQGHGQILTMQMIHFPFYFIQHNLFITDETHFKNLQNLNHYSKRN